MRIAGAAVSGNDAGITGGNDAGITARTAAGITARTAAGIADHIADHSADDVSATIMHKCDRLGRSQLGRARRTEDN